MSFNGINMEGMTSAGQPMTGSAPVKKMSMWHAMIVDWRLTNPADPWSACARFFDVSAPWLSTIINSDLFKAYYAERLETHQEFLSKELIAKASRTASKGLDTMFEKMEYEGKELGLDELSKATDMAMKSLGFGVKVPATQAPVSINFGTLDPSALAAARDTMNRVAVMNTADTAEVIESVVPETGEGGEGYESSPDSNDVSPPKFDPAHIASEPERKPVEEPVTLDGSSAGTETEYMKEDDEDGDDEFLREILANTG